MSGRSKRTYKVKDSTIDIVDELSENTGLDKQQVVDRAVHTYAKLLQEGKVDDPVINDELLGAGGIDVKIETEDSEEGSLLDRIRGKK
jgi:hypothetical protein